jgi:hypothetical protein
MKSFNMILILCLFSVFFWCKGPEGPPGPGTRIVYEGIAESSPHVVVIPELHLENFPLIECYYYLDDAWTGMYAWYTEGDVEYSPYAAIYEQRVDLLGIDGLPYRIVIVI